jgi:hypothetical protein
MYGYPGFSSTKPKSMALAGEPAVYCRLDKFQ